ncbi:Protein PhnA [Bacillus sp. ZZV12-4809]|nr:Protein PhnA [Bacillus sp. ZZV12-4809]
MTIYLLNECNSEYTYEDRSLFVCPECAHEWSLNSETENSENQKQLQTQMEMF